MESPKITFLDIVIFASMVFIILVFDLKTESIFTYTLLTILFTIEALYLYMRVRIMINLKRGRKKEEILEDMDKYNL